jgi:hypothetical protein
VARQDISKLKMAKLPKELAAQDKIKKAVEQAQKDFDSYLSALKGLEGPRKKAGKSQEVLQKVLGDYVEQEKDDKKCDIAVEYSEQVDPIHRILRWGRA